MPKRKCSFNSDYTKEWDFIKQGKHSNEAVCRICNCPFSIAHGGKADIVQHINTKKHKLLVPSTSTVKSVSEYFIKKGTGEEDKIIAAELAMAYHAVKHHQSFNTCDCNNKLFSTIFPDSKIAEKYRNARTKCTALVKNVIAPNSVTNSINDMKTNTKFFAISTDASNHNNEKIFPIVVQYFTQLNGICIKLLRVESLPNETSDSIAELCNETIALLDLDGKKCIAFCGDNCNTNFGGRERRGKDNVYFKLKNTINDDMEGVGCPAHIVHNSMRSAADTLSTDIEVIVMKIFSHFSVYTVRTELLKDFCNFVGIQYQMILSHSKTRWLSLVSAVERILKLFEGLKSYFLSSENSPKILIDFFSSPLSEAYLFLVHSLMHTLSVKVLQIEGGDRSIVEVLATLRQTESIFKERMDENFLPLSLKTILNATDVTPQMKSRFLGEVKMFYRTGHDYLVKWMNEITKYEVFSWMLLKTPPTWKELEESCSTLKNKNVSINDNNLFTEWGVLRDFVAKSQENDNEKWSEKSSQSRWQDYFQACDLKCQFQELLTICQYVFAIPAHNAHVERIFSLMTVQWTKERNRLDVTTVEAILQILTNESKSCTEYYSFCLGNKKLLNEAKSKEKY